MTRSFRAGTGSRDGREEQEPDRAGARSAPRAARRAVVQPLLCVAELPDQGAADHEEGPVPDRDGVPPPHRLLSPGLHDDLLSRPARSTVRGSRRPGRAWVTTAPETRLGCFLCPGTALMPPARGRLVPAHETAAGRAGSLALYRERERAGS